MANINRQIKTEIQAPDIITIKLVRHDLLGVSNNYRLFFEISLAISSALIGVILSQDDSTSIHWLFLAVMAIAAVVFAFMSFRVYDKACKMA